MMCAMDAPAERTTGRGRAVLLALLLAVAAFAAYAPSLGAGFIAYDDYDVVVENEVVTEGTLGGLAEIWTGPVFYSYLPMYFSSLWVDHLLFGDTATGYRVVNLLLHILAGEGGTRPWLDLGPAVANALTALFAVGVLGAVIFVTRRPWRGDGPSAETWRADWSLLVIASLLIPSLCWDHYTVQLLPVLMIGAWGMSTSAHLGMAARIGAAVTWLAAAALLAVPVPHWDPALRGGLGLIVMSTRLWGMLLMLGLVLWWRLSLGPEERDPPALPARQ